MKQKYKKIKSAVYNLIREDDTNTIYANIFDGIIIGLIILNLLLVTIDTFDPPEWFSAISNKIELISVIIFTIEYLMRLWTSDLKYADKNGFIARLKYIFSLMALIDLLAILPFYLPFIFPVDLRALRALRLLRLFRIFKVSRYISAFGTIADVFRRKAHQLISSMIIVGVLMVITSILMYSVEHEAQPEIFKNAFSGIWWAVATLTTVGYGDIYPITTAGRILSGCIALLGIGLVAVPTGIISAGFMEIVDDEKQEDESKDEINYCPNCGHKLK
ncbi:MAG: ion transporter [Eubacteriales bacterium]